MLNNDAIRGVPKSSKPSAGGAAIRQEPVFGVVKNNADAIRSGRLEVYISDMCGDKPDNADNWKKVNFLSPFYGFTPSTGGQTGSGTYLQNPSSYGMWFSPPDIGTTVICIFVNGQEDYGYWIGCVPKPEALHMVPAIGASDNIIPNQGEADSFGGATRLPVTNINTNSPEVANSASFLTQPKPIHSYQAGIYAQQGLLRDTIRGPIGSSAQRESPSRVGFGVSTPGRPIYEGGYTDESVSQNLNKESSSKLKLAGRRGGHSIVMDDGDIIGRDQLIRIRTATGHQIMMSDDGQCLNIMHSNGQSWIELGKEGTIDMYATNSINLRTQGDLNLHADNSININAMKGINIAATENIEVNTEKDMNFRIGANFNTYTIGKYMVKVNDAMTLASAGPAGFASDDVAYINGSKVNLNTGSAPAQPAEVTPIPLVAQTDTLHDQVKGWAAAPGKLMTIVSRAPAHAPWANWGQGVDVKIDNNAASSLPAPPSNAVADANAAAATTPDNPVTVASASTVPSVGAISGALDQNVTATMVGAAAKTASDAAASAVSTGIGTVTNAAGDVTAAVGSLGLTPKGLVDAGMLKPGADKLVDGLVAGGSSVAAALTPNLFTGKAGAANLGALVNNPIAQVSAQVTNFQQAQTTLTKVGVISGNEAPQQLAGLVQAGATAGAAAVTDFVKNASGAVTGGINAVTGAGNEVSKAMASGNFAAGLATNVTGGLGSIAGALSGAVDAAGATVSGLLNSALGVAGSAFAAVTKAFPKMQAGVPQNLTAIASKSAAGAAADITGSVTTALNTATTVAGAVTAGANGALTSGATAALAGFTGSVTAATGAMVKNVTTGLSGIPGGMGSVSTIVNNAIGSLNAPAGLGPVTDLINVTSTAVTNGISAANAAASSLTGMSAGSMAGIANKGSELLAKGTDLLKDPTKTLSSLATAGLPAGAAAQLNAAISALSSGGPVQIKMPVVAVGTIDTKSVTAQLASTFGDSKIPLPNLSGEVSASAKAGAESITAKVNQVLKLQEQMQTQSDVIAKAREAYLTAKQDLPQGDPSLAQLESAYKQAVAKNSELANQITSISNSA